MARNSLQKQKLSSYQRILEQTLCDGALAAEGGWLTIGDSETTDRGEQADQEGGQQEHQEASQFLI